ncbi:MAG: hypothetical protein HUJ58_08470, partial [Erysipelotrichaceae bacterium]|nr:hypothetical protein [Erysipelotrichaceae bacterium]
MRQKKPSSGKRFLLLTLSMLMICTLIPTNILAEHEQSAHPICGKESGALICEQSEEQHVHRDDCYHNHSESCYPKVETTEKPESTEPVITEEEPLEQEIPVVTETVENPSDEEITEPTENPIVEETTEPEEVVTEEAPEIQQISEIISSEPQEETTETETPAEELPQTEEPVIEEVQEEISRNREAEEEEEEEEETFVYSDTDYTFEIRFANSGSETVVDIDKDLNLLDSSFVTLVMTRKDKEDVTEAETANYVLQIASVTSSSDEFNWDGSDTITTSEDANISYTVHYVIYNKERNATVKDPDDEDVNISAKAVFVTSDGEKILETLDTDDQYISNALVSKYVTGTEPFDDDDEPGNDSSKDNRIIRTFDTATYTIKVQSESYSPRTYYKKGYVGFYFSIPYTKEEVTIDTGSMGWMTSSTGTSYDYQYKDHGSYQTLVAYRYLDADALHTESTFPITELVVNLSLKVHSMKNNDTIQPTVYTWIDGNDIDLSNPDYICDVTKHANAANNGKELYEIPVEELTVSATPRYNVRIQKAGDAYAKTTISSYNFATGNNKALNKDKGTVDGTIAVYGLTLQLYNNADGKGLKGIELPQGDITFDVTLEATYSYTDSNSKKQTVTLDDKYTPLVWSYDAASSAATQGDGRIVNAYSNTYATGSAPHNNYSNKTKTKTSAKLTNNFYCWEGGTWSATQEGNVVHFTVSGYEVNPQFFPHQNASGTADIYYKSKTDPEMTRIGCFSAGELFVVYPVGNGDDFLPVVYQTEEGSGYGTINTTVTDSNLRATSISNQSLPIVTDNSNQGNPGMGKTDTAGDDKQQANLTVAKGKSGSDTFRIFYTSNPGVTNGDWNGAAYPNNNYDNGLDVSLQGQSGGICALLQTNIYREPDNIRPAVNLLLKFDDKAFIPNGKYGLNTRNEFSTSLLWVAKSDKTGWDSDQEMNSAQEGWDKFVYFTSLQELQDKGYTCVAVLLERRIKTPDALPTTATETTINHYFFLYGNAADDLEIGYVAQCVIAGRFWNKTDYEAAKAEGYTDKKEGYEKVIPSRLSGLSMPEATYVSPITGTYDYRKTEYDSEGYVTYQDAQKQHGDSLYILNYTSEIAKSTLQTNKDNSRKETFDLDSNQTDVDYRLDWGMKINEQLEYAKTTTVTITEVIPAGTTFNNDLRLGGTFVPDNPLGPAYKGTVTGGVTEGKTDPDTGILFKSLTQIPNADGTVTLTIVLENVPITTKAGLPDLYYSVTIDKAAAVNGQQYTSSASIQTAEDKRA